MANTSVKNSTYGAIKTGQGSTPENNKMVPYSRGGIDISMLFLTLGSTCILIYSLFRELSHSRFSGNWAIEVTVICTIWLIFYLLSTYQHFKSIYLFSNAYVLSLILFHLGVTFQQAIGLDIPNNWGIAEYPNFQIWLARAGWYTSIALASYGIGIGLSGLMVKREFIPESTAIELRNSVLRAARWSAVGLLIASGIFAVMAIFAYGDLLSYTRADIFSSSADSRGFGAFTMVMPGAAALFLLSARNKKQFGVGLWICSLSILLFLFSGYREVALFPVMIATIVWVKSGRKLPAWLAIAGVVVVLLIISVVGILRTMGTYGDLSADKLKESYEKSSIQQSITTMGQTAGVLAHVLRLVPDTDPYRYGSSYGYALINALPNVGLSIDMSHSRNVLGQKALSDKNAIYKMAPSDWMTYRILNEQFKQGFGTGFSTIGEAYLNFGLGGVIIFFLIMGVFLGRLDHRVITYNPYIFIFCMTMLWPLLRTVRNDFANFLKPFMFNLIILIIFWTVSSIFLNRKFPKPGKHAM